MRLAGLARSSDAWLGWGVGGHNCEPADQMDVIVFDFREGFRRRARLEAKVVHGLCHREDLLLRVV